MQGVTVLAKFKELPVYLGEDIHYIDKYHPKVQKQVDDSSDGKCQRNLFAHRSRELYRKSGSVACNTDENTNTNMERKIYMKEKSAK